MRSGKVRFPDNLLCYGNENECGADDRDRTGMDSGGELENVKKLFSERNMIAIPVYTGEASRSIPPPVCPPILCLRSIKRRFAHILSDTQFLSLFDR